MTEFRVCAIIPTLNHYKALAKVVEDIQKSVRDVIIIDDGSNFDARDAIQIIGKSFNSVEILRHSMNMGKGAALRTGFNRAQVRGFTHALQIDADGQHDLNDTNKLLEASKNASSALITAKPIYDASMPFGRKMGRWITHFWVWIETLSFSISDSMCGFRIYPISSSLDVMKTEIVGKRMDFDTSIMVRLFWRGVDVIEIPSKVIYPKENTSNFDVLKDNILITQMHTRLVFGMLLRLLTFRLRWKT